MKTISHRGKGFRARGPELFAGPAEHAQEIPLQFREDWADWQSRPMRRSGRKQLFLREIAAGQREVCFQEP